MLLFVCLFVAGASRAGIKDSVYFYILKYEIKHPEVVLKQAILETGWFTSKHLMDKNNLFAFRSTKKYMRFESVEDCVKYYKQWQDKYYTDTTKNYYLFLKHTRFAHSPDYVTILKHIRLSRSQGAPQPVARTRPKTKKPAKK